MEPLTRNRIPTTHLFILAGMILLATGMVFGVVGGLQYVIQGFIKSILSFDKIRPLHVSSVVFWIILAAVGSVMTYLQQHIALVFSEDGNTGSLTHGLRCPWSWDGFCFLSIL